MPRILMRGAVTLGHGELDRQHEELFAYLNRMRQLTQESHSVNSEPVSELFGKMAIALTTHFNDEEELMDATAMPEYLKISHRKAHSKIMDEFIALQTDIMYRRECSIEQAIDFVYRWIYSHTTTHDLQLKPYLQQIVIKSR